MGQFTTRQVTGRHVDTPTEEQEPNDQGQAVALEETLADQEATSASRMPVEVPDAPSPGPTSNPTGGDGTRSPVVQAAQVRLAKLEQQGRAARARLLALESERDALPGLLKEATAAADPDALVRLQQRQSVLDAHVLAAKVALQHARIEYAEAELPIIQEVVLLAQEASDEATVEHRRAVTAMQAAMERSHWSAQAVVGARDRVSAQHRAIAQLRADLATLVKGQG